MKQVIRLTESDLHKLVKESVQKILKEQDEWDAYLQQDDPDPEERNLFYDEEPSFDERVAQKIMDDIQTGGYDFKSKTYYDLIEDLMINYGCSGNVAKLVARKIGIR